MATRLRIHRRITFLSGAYCRLRMRCVVKTDNCATCICRIIRHIRQRCAPLCIVYSLFFRFRFRWIAGAVQSACLVYFAIAQNIFTYFAVSFYIFVSRNFCAISFFGFSVCDNFPLARVTCVCVRASGQDVLALHSAALERYATEKTWREKTWMALQRNVEVMLVHFSGILCCHFSAQWLSATLSR